LAVKSEKGVCTSVVNPAFFIEQNSGSVVENAGCRDEGGSGALILKVHEEDDNDNERVEDLLSSSNGKWETMYKAPRKQW
jgi:hypothetical protein